MKASALRMARVALKVANEIYFQGLHSFPQEMEAPKATYEKKQYDLVVARDGTWDFPATLVPYRDDLSIEISDEDKRKGRGTIPVYISLDHQKLFMFIVRRDDHPEALVPLSPPLTAIFEGARILAEADPNDGGYLTRIM